MAQKDPRKWRMPGWRIEQKYSPNVLIGNWVEERNTFKRGHDKHHSSNNRVDFRNFSAHRPDIIIRRKVLLRNDGLQPEMLFLHHGNKYTNNMLTWYDEHYNGRWRENMSCPASRQWDGNKLAWVPEKADYPLQGAPTNFGLLPSLKSKWQSEIAEDGKGGYHTTYQSSFVSQSNNAMAKDRFAAPRDQSTFLHPVNKVNKDLHFRDISELKSPENLADMSARALTTVGM